jgi:tight adherence protein B
MQRFAIIFVTVVVFVAVMMALQGFYWYRITQREKESKELARRLGTISEQDQDNLFRIEVKKRGEEGIPDLAGRLVAYIEELLIQAGGGWTFQQLVTYMVAASLGGMVVLIIVTKSIAGLGGLFLGYVPLMVLKSRVAERSQRITEQLPDALDLMARSLQSGHGISDSMRVCAEEMAPPIATEFGRVYEENNLGRDYRDSMQGLVTRCKGNFDLKIFVSSVILQRETGGNLVEILENISGTIRQRFVFKGKVSALTAEARFSSYVLGGLPFLVGGLIGFMRPEYLSPLIEDPLGRFMLGFIIIWFTLGVFVMGEITKVEI